MKRLVVSLPDELFVALRAEQAASGIGLSELTRRALIAELANRAALSTKVLKHRAATASPHQRKEQAP